MQGNGEGRGRADRDGRAANDNHGPEAHGSGPPVPPDRSPGQAASGPGGQARESGGAEARIDAAVMRLARLIGRQIAREEFDGLKAANDNAPEGEAHER